jgi:hypothetical protein
VDEELTASQERLNFKELVILLVNGIKETDNNVN